MRLRIKECDCEKWKRNIFKLIFPFIITATNIGEYTGEVIEYCPWCGKELKNA